MPGLTPIPNAGPKDTSTFGRLVAHNDILFAFGLAMVLATLLIPLPTFLLDLLLACSIALAVGTMIVVLSTRESVELSTFPSLLLFLTLFRLSLNVASTRLILMQCDAGRIIQTFGQFVAGGSLTIGLVVFLILVVIQFIVITKGAERISEVAARFNLDAMPGKQMSIDADLNAGLINENEAKARREKIVRESEFYGAMDGASKFIRGDAIAGLIITAVNLVGGMVIGLTRGMSLAQSAETYSILAIGDGLVSQIPAIVISTSAGFLISKTSTLESLSHDLVRQMFARSRPIGIAAVLFGAMVFVPGFPKVPFIVLSLGAGLLARTLAQREHRALAKPPEPKAAEPGDEPPVETMLDVDRIAVQVGARLIRTVDPRRKDSVFHRIGPLRRRFAQDYGIVLPLVRLRDQMALDPNVYEIRIHGHVVATGRLEAERFLAMDPGTVTQPIKGQATKEPVFNLPALWITPDQKEEATLAGYTVVDPESVLVTHLSETLRRHAHEILSRDDVQTLVDRLREREPTLVGGVVGENVPLGLLHRVLQNLLKDRIPIRNLPQIIETLGDHAAGTRDPSLLTELVRKVLARTVSEQHADDLGHVQAVVLEPSLEYELRGLLAQEGASETLALAPDRALDLARRIGQAWHKAMNEGHEKAVLLCDYRLRPHMAAMLSRQLPDLPILAYDEVAVGTPVDSVATVPAAPAAPAAANVAPPAAKGGRAGRTPVAAAAGAT
ncbi:MAG: flagellar biosynthesis protein FlhA [Planctomycetes bacterium]|nr:flagellar biosynthesis protein FlhA [Planctomycetota bacterium]